jgi:hypothetical protein
MFAMIEKDVHETISHFTRCAQGARMKTIAPNGPSQAEDTVECARKPHGKADQSARQRRIVLGFHDQVDVVVLKGVVNDTKPPPRSGGERLSQR